MRRFALQNGQKVQKWRINSRTSRPARYPRGDFYWEWHTFRCLSELISYTGSCLLATIWLDINYWCKWDWRLRISEPASLTVVHPASQCSAPSSRRFSIIRVIANGIAFPILLDGLCDNHLLVSFSVATEALLIVLQRNRQIGNVFEV
jgi:hypothetical protein